jgi:hypothetical protein
MSQRIRTFGRLVSNGKTYIPRVYAELNSEGSWSAYIAFIPVTGHNIATDYLTSGPTVGGLIDWADVLTTEDLHAALGRAKILSRASTLAADIARLEILERDALADAEEFEDEAARDEAAAEAAREDAEILHSERLQTETAAAEWQEKMANASAVEDEHAAQDARARAAKAKRRKKAAESTRSKSEPSGTRDS